ncbi:hypothetical protein RintRC_5937 [Richelia intracellularis]|nr:hypothetical protein RintRC_5937 [Richelia intracellularis]
MDLDRDIIHVIEYLWKTGFVFYSQTSTQAEVWESKRLQLILEGKSSSVAPGMGRSATLPQLTPPKNLNPWIPVLDIYFTMPNTSNMTIT